jgi:hypothetical protein
LVGFGFLEEVLWQGGANAGLPDVQMTRRSRKYAFFDIGRF